MTKQKETKILPKGWATATVGEVSLKIHYGYTATTSDEDTGVKYLRITDITDFGVDWEKVPFCKIKEAELENYSLKQNDLVFARTGGTVGKSFLIKKDVPENSVFASYLIRIIGSKNINVKYLSYFFQSHEYWHHIELNKTGLKTNVNAQILSSIEFNLPPSNEQNRIVSKLDELFSDLENGKKQIEIAFKQIKIYRQSLLNHAFNGKLSEQWRKSQKKINNANELIQTINNFRKQEWEKERVKFKTGKRKSEPKIPFFIEAISKKESKNLTELPKEWSWVRLGDICSDVERVNTSDRKFSNQFLYLDIGGIDNETNKIARHKIYEWGNAPSRAQQIVNIGDILFSTVRTYMKNIAYVDNPKFNHQIASTGFTVIRPESRFINSKYIFNYVLSESFLRPLNELQTGSSYPAVRDKDVFNQLIPICSKDEQDFIESELEKRFSICSNLEETISESIKQCESLKQTILQKAFEGLLVEQNPNDEPAEILLEKIKQEREIFIEEEKNRKQNLPRTLKTIDMAEQLKTILELIQKSKKPISPLTLWQASEHKDDIDAFYAKLKEHIDKGEIKELPRKGKEIFLTATSAK